MKNYFCLLLLLPLWCFAQKEGNFWTFGYCNSINFNSGSPVYGGVPGTGDNINTNISFNRSNTVADANGRLLFYAKLTEYDKRLPHNSSLYDANGGPMANSELAIASPVVGAVQIAKNPGNDFLYYVIYSLNHALLYTTVDMRLNNGLGGIVPGAKNVVLSGWQTIVGEKTTIVQGCDGLWLVVRSRTANQYLSFKITAAGIDPKPVISECGLLPLNAYSDPWCSLLPGISTYGGMTRENIIGVAGSLRTSPDGSKIVACCCGGLELYHFSPCSGKLSKPVLADTASKITVNYSPICRFGPTPIHVYFNSACFSPDNSKLYATYFLLPYVFQYDLNVPQEKIMDTKTRVLTNQPTWSYCGCCCQFSDTIGIDDLKLGPDGKIYIPNNGQYNCPHDSTPGYMTDWALHAINNPNLSGLACNPQHNSIVLGPLTGSSKFITYHSLNPPIVLPPALPDTLTAVINSTLTKLL